MSRIEPAVAGRATIDLNRIATWVQVVKTGSITRAAQELGRPKSSVSRAIKHLEAELGMTLLQRSTRKLTLTRAGERYLESAREALRLLDEAHAELVNEDGVPRGTVRFTAPLDPGYFGAALADSLAEFHARYPQVYVDVLFTGRHVDLVSEGVDFALRAGVLRESALIARRLAESQLVLVAAPRYLAQHGTPRKVKDLEQHRAVLFHSSPGTTTWKLSAGAKTESANVHGPVNVDEIGFLVPLVERGVGIALVPELVARRSLHEGRIVRVLPGYSRRDASIFLVYPAQRQVPKRVALLRDFLFRSLRSKFAG